MIVIPRLEVTQWLLTCNYVNICYFLLMSTLPCITDFTEPSAQVNRKTICCIVYFSSHIFIFVIYLTTKLQKQQSCVCLRICAHCLLLGISSTCSFDIDKLLKIKNNMAIKETAEWHTHAHTNTHAVKHLVVILYLTFKWLTAVPWLICN